MATVLLFDSANEVARLQYHMIHAAPDLQIEVTSDAFRAVESTARTRPAVVVVSDDTAESDICSASGVTYRR